MRVRFEHAPDLDACLRRRLDVLLDRERGVDDDSLAGVRVADEIRATAQVLVDELPEEERPASSVFGGARARVAVAMTIRCTSFVPSPISRIFWSR